jgi:Tol biopolymer transport system component
VIRGLTRLFMVAAATVLVGGAAAGLRADGSGAIVFTALPGGAQVLAVNSDGTDLQQITHALDGDGPSFATWAPSLDQVAYSTGSYGIVVARADGSGYRLVADDADVSRPSWSPDGRSLAYERSAASGPEVWLADIAADGSRPLGPGNAPVFSPDGKSVAAGDGHDLVVYDLASGERRVVATVQEHATWPSWSPDGRELAFTEINPDGGESPDVRLAGASGFGSRILARDSRRAYWSPDGTSIAVLRLLMLPAGTPAAIDILRPDGSLESELASDGAYTLSWSPDSRAIAYNTADLTEAVVVDVDGGSRKVVATGGTDGAIADVSWRPGGRRLALVFWSGPAQRAALHPQLFAVDPAGGLVRQLTTGAEHGQPDWSANGEWLALMERVDKRSSILVMHADGSAARRVATGSEPALSPAAARLAFVRGGRILVTSLAGGRPRVLRSGAWPAWSPNGKAIAYFWRGTLWTTRPDGTHLRRLLRVPGAGVRTAPPVWLRTGDIYVGPPSDGPVSPGILVRPNGSNLRTVDLSRASTGSPHELVAATTPAPDGGAFAVVVFLGGRVHIAVVSGAGGSATTILRTDGGIFGPLAWRPV